MKVQITIRGRNYTVRSDEPDEDLATIAKYVDAKMSEIGDRASGLDDYSVAMLAALNIASEFERFRREVGASLDGLDQELAATAVLVRAALPGEDVEEG